MPFPGKRVSGQAVLTGLLAVVKQPPVDTGAFHPQLSHGFERFLLDRFLVVGLPGFSFEDELQVVSSNISGQEAGFFPFQEVVELLQELFAASGYNGQAFFHGRSAYLKSISDAVQIGCRAVFEKLQEVSSLLL